MAHETRLLRHIILRTVVAVEVVVGEIAAAAAGNADFFTDFRGVIEQGDTMAALANAGGAHHAGGAGADDEGVENSGLHDAVLTTKGENEAHISLFCYRTLTVFIFRQAFWLFC